MRPAGQTQITDTTSLTAAQAGGAVAVAGGLVVVGQFIRGAFWGGLAALLVNVVRGGRRSSRSRRKSR